LAHIGGLRHHAGRERLAWPVRLAIGAVAQIIAFLTANLSRFGLPARVRP